MNGLKKEQVHFKRCVQIASQIGLVRINRPTDGYKLKELVDLIEQDFIVRGLHHAC